MAAVNFSSGVYELPPAFDEPPLSPIYTEDTFPVFNEATLHRKMEEKIRDEIELKLRAEQEARLAEQEVQRQLAEQKQKVQEEQKQIIELRAEIQKCERINERTATVVCEYEKLLSSGHEILMWNNFGSGTLSELRFYSSSGHLGGHHNVDTGDIYILVTQKGVFRHIRKQHRPPESSYVYEICPLYTFANPLNSKQLKMLLHLSQAIHFANPLTKVCEGLARKEYHIDHKKFESVIRLIPGSYSNGAWKQLDGFFGAYINEETMEIMGGAPPM